MDSLAQISEEQDFTAISEPDFDLEAVEVPDEGPMTFEFDIEVRPEFDLPEVEGPEARAAGPRVHRRRRRQAARADAGSRYGQLVPFEGAAADAATTSREYHLRRTTASRFAAKPKR